MSTGRSFARVFSRAEVVAVPQIVVPHLLDQFYFALRAHELGVAPPALARRKLTAAALAERVSAALDNELLAERAAELGRRLAALEPIETHLPALLDA